VAIVRNCGAWSVHAARPAEVAQRGWNAQPLTWSPALAGSPGMGISLRLSWLRAGMLRNSPHV